MLQIPCNANASSYILQILLAPKWAVFSPNLLFNVASVLPINYFVKSGIALRPLVFCLPLTFLSF